MLEQEAVFVLSTGRCGTELLTHLFELVPGTLPVHRPEPELAYASKVAYGLARQGDADDVIQKMILAGRFEILLESHIRRRRYIETNNRITFFAPAIAALMPNARFIHLVRDAEAFVRSGVRREYYSGVPTDLGRIVPTAGRDAADWPTLSAIGRCAWLWSETNLYIDAFRRSLARPERFTAVRSSELYSDPAATADLVRFCGLQAPSPEAIARLQSHKANEQLRGPDPGPMTAWSESDQAQFRRFVERFGGAGGGG
ncbi:sulfotransferase [Brevundimonas sp.]|uniref:sulfotransferase n=1 Tax=Brevundimonas sp. TaxID=1871086 RepID=UPI002D2974F3|nr:sulfotransferase [Brevundimonas sp.]HYC67397.1 sulfotransferase [Brevundimonas sp.]